MDVVCVQASEIEAKHLNKVLRKRTDAKDGLKTAAVAIKPEYSLH